MQLVLITPPSHVATDVAQELRHVNSMFDAGLRVLHLRKPSAERADIEGYLRGISPQHRAKVVLHQHHSLAAEWKLKVGVVIVVVVGGAGDVTALTCPTMCPTLSAQ